MSVRSKISILSGLKVLDLSSILAGPTCTSFLAECGAEITKIENLLTKGDATRSWKLPSEDQSSSLSAYYASANYGKQVILLDLTNQEHQVLLNTEIQKADIIVSNFQQSVAVKYNVDPYDLQTKYPYKIIVQLSAYTYEDPRPGYDLIMQCETGWISMNGPNEQQLCKLPVALMDLLAAHQMKEAILLALLKKAESGIGSLCLVSLFKSAISGLANQATNYIMAGHIAKPIGTLHPNIAPYGDQFVTKDGFIIILAIGSDVQFKKLWETLSLDDKKYPTFAFNQQRVVYRNQLHAILASQISQIKYTSLANALHDAKLAFSKVNAMDEAFINPLAQSMILVHEIEAIQLKSISNLAFEIR